MPSGKRGRFPVGTPVLDAARQLGVYVESVCGGRATCGRCQIEVQEGNFAKHKIVSSQRAHFAEGPQGRALRARARACRTDRRLSCSATILGDLVIDVPQDTVDQRAGRAQGGDRPRHRAQCRRPALLCRGRRARHAQAARRSRPAEGHAREGLGLEGPARRCRMSFREVQKMLRKGNWGVTAAIHRDMDPSRPFIIGAVAGPQERSLWHRLRHRLDHHRHASGVAAVGPHRGLVGHARTRRSASAKI